MFTKEALESQYRYGFSESAVETLNLSQQAAADLGHSYIGSEHLLLGICEVGSPALRVLGIDVVEVRREILFIVGSGFRSAVEITADSPGLTPGVSKIIGLSIAEARRQRQEQLTNDHLLIGAVNEDNAIAAGVLDMLGVNSRNVRIAARISGDKEGAGIMYPAVLWRLERFFIDPGVDISRKQQVKMILEGALGLMKSFNHRY